MASSPNFFPHHCHPVPMITMRVLLAPALLLLLLHMAAVAPHVPAMTAEEETKEKLLQGAHKEDLADKLSIASVEPDAYAADQKSVGPNSKKKAVKDAVDKTSYVMGVVPEQKLESKSDEKKLKKEAKVITLVKGDMNYEDTIAEKNEENKSKLKSGISEDDDAQKEKKTKNKDDDGKEKISKNRDDDDYEKKEKNSKSKDKDSIYDTENTSKNKDDDDDDDDDEKKDKKFKSKYDDDDDDNDKKEKKLKNKDDDDDDEKKEKKLKNKDGDNDDQKNEKKLKNKDDDDDEKKKKKKSKKKSDSSEDDGAEKKSKSKSEFYENAGDKKKSKSKNKTSKEDFDAVPVEAKADESMPAVDTTDGYQAPTTKTKPQLPAADTPNSYAAPTTAQPKMSAANTPNGYAAPTTQMSTADTPDGYVTPSKAQSVMSATDSPEGYVPATDSPDGNVPATDSPDGNVQATDSPDGYAAPTKPKVDVQSYSEMVPQPVLRMLSPLVKSMCAKTSYPYACEASIARLPETAAVPGRQKNLLGVLTLAIDAVRAKIVEAKNAATDVSKDPHVDKLSKGAISDCIGNYDDMNYQFDSALTALKRGDKATARSALDAARTAVDTCDNGFLDRPQLKPILGDYEKVLAQLSSNVLAMNANAKQY